MVKCSYCRIEGHNILRCETNVIDICFKIFNSDPDLVLSENPHMLEATKYNISYTLHLLNLVRVGRVNSVVLERNQRPGNLYKHLKYMRNEQNEFVFLDATKSEYDNNVRAVRKICLEEWERYNCNMETYKLKDALQPWRVDERRLQRARRNQERMVELDNFRQAERLREQRLERQRQQARERQQDQERGERERQKERERQQEQQDRELALEDPVEYRRLLEERTRQSDNIRREKNRLDRDTHALRLGLKWGNDRDTIVVSEDCPVCMEELGETDKIVFRCGHQTCITCAVHLHRGNIPCPTCRGRWV